MQSYQVIETHHSECFCREEDLDDPSGEENLDHFLDERKETTMMNTDTSTEELPHPADLRQCLVGTYQAISNAQRQKRFPVHP